MNLEFYRLGKVACCAAALMFTVACDETEESPEELGADANVEGAVFEAEIWADNWFAMYVGDELVKEDSVPITTERSFNAETFQFNAELPFRINLVIKDYKENDTGLEYIGEPNQQMGDGGFIAQIKRVDDSSLVAVSEDNMLCKVIHTAPLNKECEKDSDPEATCQFLSEDEPADWKLESFDRSEWVSATEHSENAVQPKEGYDEIAWETTAQLVWTDDLESDNTLLCSLLVEN